MARARRHTAYQATRGRARVTYPCSECGHDRTIFSEDDEGNIFCKGCTLDGYRHEPGDPDDRWRETMFDGALYCREDKVIFDIAAEILLERVYAAQLQRERAIAVLHSARAAVAGALTMRRVANHAMRNTIMRLGGIRPAPFPGRRLEAVG
jgi:ribosomal protein S27E